MRQLDSKRFRFLLLGSFAASALIAGPAASGERQVSLPGGTLDTALAALATQTGEQLVFSPDLVAGLRAQPLSGRYSVDEALARLLAGSNLEATRAGPKVVVLRRRAARATVSSQPASGPVETAPPFGGDRTVADASRPADAPPPADARASPPPAPTSTMVEAVEVTGTHIRGGGLSPSPLVVLDTDDLQRTGYATIAGALSVLPQNFGGLNTEGTIATRADGAGNNNSYATGINLRGLGSNATLVLVNGRRLGGSGISGDFADVSGLPAVAVSRVEVLLDGASAVYGSDAVGGVVNVILRRDLEGGQARFSVGTGASDTPREYQAGVVFGHSWSGGNLLIAYEANKREALASADRRWTASADLRPFGGADRRLTNAFPGNVVAVNPATGVSGPFFGIPAGQPGTGLTPASFQAGVINRTSLQDGQDVLPAQQRQSAYLAVHQDVTPRIELSGDLRYSFRSARVANAASVSTFTVTRADPFFVSPNGTASSSIQYSFAGELPNPVIRATAESLTGSLGARAKVRGDWVVDGYLGYAQEFDEAHAGGVANTAILAEALGNVADRPETAYSPSRDGFFNPYTGVAANRASVMAAIGSGFSVNRTRSRVRTANLQADGTLFTLPGGPVKAALGVNARRETFRRNGSSYTSTVAPTPQTSVSGDRSVAAVFAETRVPLIGPDNARPGLAGLEVSGALRAERYSDFGHSIDPKVGVVWTPVDGLRVRGTYGTSFRAPSLNQLLSVQMISPLFIGTGAAQVLTLSRQGGNPDLKPESATTYTLGFDLQGAWAPRTRLSVTWFDTDFKGRIAKPVNENVQGALTDPRFAPFVQRLSPASNSADLALVQALLARPEATAAAGLNPPASYVAIVDLRSVNTGSLRVRGLDAQVTHSLDLFGGELTLRADGTRLFDYIQALTPTSPGFERVGLVTFPAKFRGRLGGDWRRDRISAGATFNYTSAFHTAAGDRIDDQSTVDLRARWEGRAGALSNTAVTLAVRNVFNAAPPFYDNPLGFAYDPANADVVGRFVSLQLTRRW